MLLLSWRGLGQATSVSQNIANKGAVEKVLLVSLSSLVTSAHRNASSPPLRQAPVSRRVPSVVKLRSVGHFASIPNCL